MFRGAGCLECGVTGLSKLEKKKIKVVFFYLTFSNELANDHPFESG